MKKETYNQLKERVEALEKLVNGGKGSGNHNPGQGRGVGKPGSGGGKGGSSKTSTDELGSIKKNIDRAREYRELASEHSLSYTEEADKEAARAMGLDPSTMASTKEKFWDEAVSSLETKYEDKKSAQLEEIRKKNNEEREAKAKNEKAERAEHIKAIDKALGKEKVRMGETKEAIDADYKKLEKDISKVKEILSKEKSRENFGQEEVRKLRDKYFDYMYGNYYTTGRFQQRIKQFEDWASNYQNW